MRRLVIAVLLGGCGGASLVSVKLTNGTDRPIDQVFVYPLGAANHGVSRGVLAPHASMMLQVPGGNIEVQAVSATINVDDHTRERRQATTGVELKALSEVVFYDEGQKPQIPPKAIGVQFQHFVAGPQAPGTPASAPDPSAPDPAAP